MVVRTHPPALLGRTARTLKEETQLERGDGVIVAVSGGADSMALLHVLALLAPRLGIQLHAHGVDHGLRAEARAELSVAEQQARRLGVPFSRSELSLQPSGNLQARARAVRYEALERVARAEGARWVATGHHADDRAETVLQRILRGSGLTGLAVLPASSERRLRPMIRSTRRCVSLHLERHGLSWCEDPSNDDHRFQRSSVRHQLLPQLEKLSPAVRAHLCALADEACELPAAVVTDAQGVHLRLGRDQRNQIQRARKLSRKGVRVWLRGGRELQLRHGAACGEEVVITEPTCRLNAPESRRPPQKPRVK